MKRGNAGVTIVALLAFAAYSVFVVVVAISGEGRGPVFWTSIVLIVLLAAAAVWGAKRVYAKPSQERLAETDRPE